MTETITATVQPDAELSTLDDGGTLLVSYAELDDDLKSLWAEQAGRLWLLVRETMSLKDAAAHVRDMLQDASMAHVRVVWVC